MYFPVISKADAMRAKYYKTYSPSPVIRDRMNVICLRYKLYRPGACADAVGVHHNSVTRWTRTYIKDGLEGLLSVEAYRPQSDLVPYATEIKNDFTLNPPRSIGHARKRIAELTGLFWCITQIRKFLKNVLGFRYRKFRSLPGGKKSVSELATIQSEFLEHTLNPLLDNALRGVADVYFVDAAHPVQGFQDGRVWSETPVSVRTSSGRQRVNILGALHATSHEMYSVTNTDYVTATTVVELIEFIRDENPGRRIHLVLDNARYQRCALVAKAAKRYNVHLVFLPPYSPNLNLIERFWKFLKSTALAGIYFETKAAFIEAVAAFLDQVNSSDYDEQLSTLLALNFQKLNVS
jgi:transposase